MIILFKAFSYPQDSQWLFKFIFLKFASGVGMNFGFDSFGKLKS